MISIFGSDVNVDWNQIPEQHPNVITIKEGRKTFLQFIDTGRKRELLYPYPEFWNLIDGKRTLNEIVEVMTNGHSEDIVRDFLRTLIIVGVDTNILLIRDTHESTNSDNHSDLNRALADLNELIGLYEVKQDVFRLVNFLRVQQLRGQASLPSVAITRHFVFYGNPGTGKTSVARLMGRIYKSLGVLSIGHLVETDRSGLVAGYLGQTALKVTEVVEEALGGVLFIDEAYALDSGDNYGKEAIETLLKRMEDNRDDLIVIIAGYPEKMKNLLASNPGLSSRFTKYFEFRDYLPEDLLEIFKLYCRRAGYLLPPDAESAAYDLIKEAYAEKEDTFGNARYVRNLFEKVIENQANRIIYYKSLENSDDLARIESWDIAKIGPDLTERDIELPF